MAYTALTIHGAIGNSVVKAIIKLICNNILKQLQNCRIKHAFSFYTFATHILFFMF